MQPSNSDIMGALRELHGDVKVALDRTVNHENAIGNLSTKVHGHEVDLAKAKGSATAFGAMASVVMVVLTEVGKSMFRGHSGS